MRPCRRRAIPSLAAVALLAAIAAFATRDAAAEAPPRPHAGAVPLELGQVASASGPELRPTSPDLSLAGKRVRFVGRLDSLEPTGDGRWLAVFGDGGARVTLRLPGPLDRPERIAKGRDWEVIARLDAPVALPDGRAAIAVAPDMLVKTPGPPSVVRPDDVVVELAGTTFFDDPKLPPWESEQPLYRMRVLRPGRPGDPVVPGPSALAYVDDEKGGRFLEYRGSSRGNDGSETAVRCQFRVVDGTLRSIAVGTLRTPAGGEATRDWVDFEDDRFHDRWSARERSFPPNVVASSCLLPVIAGFPVGKSRLVRFSAWGENKMPVPLYAYLDGEETIDVRGKPERALRVKTGLDVREAGRSIDVPEPWRDAAEAGSEVWFAGESTWWIAADPPHQVLRFRGLVGAPGSAEVEADRAR
ncbi:MAG: hypothetical protein ACKPBU_09340 [Alphaproteobacteria bacterium]